MNIVEAYIKFKNQFVIFISGMSGCGKTTIAKKISSKFNFNLIEQFNYFKTDFENKVMLPNNVEFNNFYTDDAINWEKLNEDINKFKSTGVIVSGFSLPNNKLAVNPDFHLHIKMSKKKCIEKRKKFLEKHKDKYPDEYKNFDSVTEKLKMNQFNFPYYLNSTSKSQINKFFSLKDEDDDNILWDQIWNYLIDSIQSYINWFNENKFSQWIKFNKLDQSINKKNNTNNDDDNSDNDDSDNDNDSHNDDDNSDNDNDSHNDQSINDNDNDSDNDQSINDDEEDDDEEDDEFNFDEFDNKIKDGPIEFIEIDQEE